MSSVNKKIVFSDIDDADPYDNNCGIIRNVSEIRFDLGCQDDEDTMGLTSSPLSRKLLQSPRKIKRHIKFAFQSWTEKESSGELNVTPNECDDLPPSPLSSRLLPESAASHVVVDQTEKPTTNPLTYSPPYKRVRALRLFDTPNTPKSIYEKSNAFEHEEQAHFLEPQRFRNMLFRDTPRPLSAAFPRLDKPVANVNPFSPQVLLRIRKRTRSLRSLPT